MKGLNVQLSEEDVCLITDSNKKLAAKEVYYYKVRDNKLQILKIQNENNTLIPTYKYQMEPGKYGCQKVEGEIETECDSEEAFDYLNMIDTNVDETNHVFFGAANHIDFIVENESFFEKMGLLNIFRKTRMNMATIQSEFLVFYTYVMKEFPSMELVIKSGNENIFLDIYEDAHNWIERGHLKDMIIYFSRIINKDETKGSRVFKLPSYIVKYLKNRNGTLMEYVEWTDIYTHENISKEVFERITESIDFKKVDNFAEFCEIPTILEYPGYKLEKLIKYISKQMNEVNPDGTFHVVERYLIDYLSMCEQCNVIPDKYPSNLLKVHDDMSKMLDKNRNKIYNNAIANRSLEIDALLNNNVVKEDLDYYFEEFEIVIPSSVASIINEGNNQKNCVGSYCDKIANNSCIIFFIRKKDDIEKSFVTCEVTSRGAGQCMYKNNRQVPAETPEYKLFLYICKIINDGEKKGTITPLKNLCY